LLSVLGGIFSAATLLLACPEFAVAIDGAPKHGKISRRRDI
jgi:hypothetical protein